MAKKNGNYLNQNGFFTLPAYETVTEVAKRLDEGANLGWPGSISITGHQHKMPGSIRRHESNKTDADRRRTVQERQNRNKEVSRRVVDKIDARLIEGARAYAAADKSDPFAFNRAMSHIKNGIAKTTHDGKNAGYEARQTTETRRLDNGMRFSDGSDEFAAVVYRDIARP